MKIPALTAPDTADQTILDQMLATLRAKQQSNIVKQTYYDGENALKDFGISLPPEMRHIAVVLGWPAKAVDALEARCVFKGFVSTANDADTFGINELMAANDADSMLPQAFASGLTNSVSFLTVTPGGDGEPEVLFRPKPATHCTGVWDSRSNSLTDALSVTVVDSKGKPEELVWYSRSFVGTFNRNGNDWTYEQQPNPTGRVWVEPLPFKPQLTRPFGYSRISRAVRALTDAAMRTLARTEAHAEFFASPQRWALGVDPEQFGQDMDRWKAVMSRLLTVTRDEEGNVPEMGQFAQVSMTPHIDQLRMLASLFAGETSLPLSSLGIYTTNPSSAEAILADKEDLVIVANRTMRVWGNALRRAAITGIMIRDNLTEAEPELAALRADWGNPATPSAVSTADAISKQVAAIPWLGESEVIIEALGYNEVDTARLMADKRRSQGSQMLLEQLAARRSPAAIEA